jgi:hypothetical protein
MFFVNPTGSVPCLMDAILSDPRIMLEAAIAAPTSRRWSIYIDGE